MSRAEPAALPPALRARLAAEWSCDGQLEHSSIASFARLSLQLLSFGAPPALLTAVHVAAIEEVEHARRCFLLAGRYAGTPVAPGPLSLHDAGALETTLARFAADAVAEGCVAESLGALEAADAAEGAQDDEARALQQRIATDESRHAELAFRLVRWALDRGDPAVAPAVAGAFDAADAALGPCPAADPDEDALRAHGRLTARRRWELRERAFAELIAPARAALLERR